MREIANQAGTWEEKGRRLRAKYAAMTAAERREAVFAGIELTVETVFETSICLREMIEAGDPEAEELRERIGGIGEFCLQIAYGQISPKLYYACGHRRHLFEAARRLPPPEQEKIADGQRMEFAEGADTRMVDPRGLNKRQIEQLFDGSRVRSLGEQRAWLRSAPPPPRARHKAVIEVEAETIDAEDLTAEGKGAIKPEWRVAIDHMAKENGYSKPVAQTIFLIALGKSLRDAELRDSE